MATIEVRNDAVATERILRALPAWFGIEESTREYVEDARHKRSYLAAVDGTVVGVALLQPHFPESVELHLIAVHPDHRGRGVGTELLHRIEQDLRTEGVQLFQVKTVGASFEDPGYAETRAFYRARGFAPIEEFSNLGWDGPTVIMVKPIAQR